MQGKQPRLTHQLMMMMEDAERCPFVGPLASFLLTQAPKVSRTVAAIVEEMEEEQRQIQAEMVRKGRTRKREEEARRAASPDYAALLADVADAATRFLELAGPHLAKIEGEGNWQQVLDANMAVAFALERAVVALVRSTQAQGNLASEPTPSDHLQSFIDAIPGPPPMTEEEALTILSEPGVLDALHGIHHGPCNEQPFTRISSQGTALIHASWKADCFWLGHCVYPGRCPEKGHCDYLICNPDTGYTCYGLTDEQRLAQHQAGLIGERDCALQGRWNFCDIPSEDRNWTEEPGMFMDGGLKGEERRYSADEDELIFDAADWLGEDK